MKQLSKRKVKERRKKGIVKAYMSRAVAVKRLQISLADFRRLCILKGVYPVEPKNKSKLSGANTRRKTYFFTRDIQMLMNEPLLFKFSEFKVFLKRLTRHKGRHDLDSFQKTLDDKPFYRLDHIVRERYPRFLDALRDCDDALSMCFLFAMFPKGPGRPDDLIDLSRKLTIEFMHYIISTKSLRKVFISIKGYYYQAEIMGQTVTWIVPHQFVIDRVSNVDLNVMKTFTEFYVTLLGFINYRLYKSINAVYPPQVVVENLKDLKKAQGICDDSAIASKQGRKRKRLGDDAVIATESRDDLIAALNKKIKVMDNKSVTRVESDDQQPDVFDEFDEENKTTKKTENTDIGNSVQDVMALERLFEGFRFFLNREVPRESLTFVIRSFGGEVSWDKNLFPGATFDESDPKVTHQIVDRTSVLEKRLDRVYIQPQWVYDSINMRIPLPTTEYLVGATLPPHLSPFVNEKRGDYVPPDKVKLINLRKQFEAEKASEERVKKGEAGIESDLETDNEFEQATALSETEDEGDSTATKKKFKPNANHDRNDIDSYDSKRSRERVSEKSRKRRERDSNKSLSRSKMEVKPGKLRIKDKEQMKKEEEQENRRLAIKMMPKKKRRLFDKITRTQKQKKQKVAKLQAKRKIVDAVRSKRSSRQRASK